MFLFVIADYDVRFIIIIIIIIINFFAVSSHHNTAVNSCMQSYVFDLYLSLHSKVI